MNTHHLHADDDDDVNGLLASGVFVTSPVDLGRYRNAQGDFTKWLQVFYLESEHKNRDPYFRITHVLPWLHPDDSIDLEFHRAASALGAYDKYPLVWRSFGWIIRPRPRSPHWAMFASNPSRGALEQQIAFATGKHPGPGIPWRNTDFWNSLERHVLVPSEGGMLTPQIVINTTE